MPNDQEEEDAPVERSVAPNNTARPNDTPLDDVRDPKDYPVANSTLSERAKKRKSQKQVTSEKQVVSAQNKAVQSAGTKRGK